MSSRSLFLSCFQPGTLWKAARNCIAVSPNDVPKLFVHSVNGNSRNSASLRKIAVWRFCLASTMKSGMPSPGFCLYADYCHLEFFSLVVFAPKRKMHLGYPNCVDLVDLSDESTHLVRVVIFVFLSYGFES